MAYFSSVVKCNSCNIVINESLAFIQNKLDVMDEESLVKICISSFTEEDIEKAKNLLFQSITSTKRNIKRKKCGKSQRDLYDIITLFKETDPEKHPIFVARELQKLPPITFDHLDATKLLKDVLIIQRDIKNIMENYITAEQLMEVKNEIYNLKEASIINNFDCNVNTKRGGGIANSFNYDSGPMGLPHIVEQNSVRNRSSQRASPTATSMTPSPSHAQSAAGLSIPLAVERHREAGTTVSATRPMLLTPPPALSYREIAPRVEAPTVVSNVVTKPAAPMRISPSPEPISNSYFAAQATVPSIKSFSRVANEEGEWKKEEKSEEWKLVQKKRLKNRFVAAAGKAATNPSERFKAADINVPLFINNVDKSTSEKDILEFIIKKTQLEVNLQRINAKTPKQYNAYKVFVPKSKLPIFLNDSFWPEGISYRRYIVFSKNFNNG